MGTVFLPFANLLLVRHGRRSIRRGGLQAQEIMEIGKTAGVTIFRNELLARALFFAGEVGEEIPPPLYAAVAAVLAFIYRLNKEEDVEAPDVDVPDDMLFDENGKALS